MHPQVEPTKLSRLDRGTRVHPGAPHPQKATGLGLREFTLASAVHFETGERTNG